MNEEIKLAEEYCRLHGCDFHRLPKDDRQVVIEEALASSNGYEITDGYFSIVNGLRRIGS